MFVAERTWKSSYTHFLTKPAATIKTSAPNAAAIYGRSGQKAQAEQQLAKLEELNHKEQIDSGVMFFGFIGIGDNEQALAILEKGYSQHSNVLRSLKVDPIFDPLRGDPRFQDLLRRVGLAQ